MFEGAAALVPLNHLKAWIVHVVVERLLASVKTTRSHVPGILATDDAMADHVVLLLPLYGFEQTR